MTQWQDFILRQGTPPAWPYTVDYDKEYEIDADILVIGGGIAGCWAAISAARKGIRVALVEKGDTVRSGAGGPGCDHWCQCPSNPHSKVDPDEWAKVLAQHPGIFTERPKSIPKSQTVSLGVGPKISASELWMPRKMYKCFPFCTDTVNPIEIPWLLPPIPVVAHLRLVAFAWVVNSGSAWTLLRRKVTKIIIMVKHLVLRFI